MYKLDQDKQILANKEILERVLKEYNVFDFIFESIKEGIANTSFLVQSASKKYILRIYAERGNSDEDVKTELAFKNYLREEGIPVPKIYKNKEGEELTIVKIDDRKWQIILMQFIEGKSVTKNPSAELVTGLARIQAKMHLLAMKFREKANNPKKILTELHDTLANEIKDIPVKTQEVLNFIERVKKYSYELNPELPYGYNHMDIDFDGNVITAENKVAAIIDFDDLQYSPMVLCLGFTLWSILDDEGLNVMKEYLKEYEKIRPLSHLEYEALPHVIFFRNYAMGMIRLLLWKESTDIKDITDILKLEKEIPTIVKASFEIK